jgi:glycosyltransferase involved in cell wall biosynthesis
MCHTGEEFGILSDRQYSHHFGYEQWYCKAALDQGFDVTLIVLSHRPKITHFQHVFGHRIIKVPIALGWGVSRQLSFDLMSVIREELTDIDLFHINSFYALQYEPLAFLLSVLRKKFVVQSQSAHYSIKNPLHLARLVSLMWSLRLAQKVLTVNWLEYINLKKVYNLNEKAVLFPNGVDTSIFKPLDLNKERHSLLFVGRLWPEKGIDILLKAFELVKRKIPNASLSIVGDGPLQKLVLENLNKFGSSLTYIPHLSPNELNKIYNMHELFVLPSLKEPFGIVVLESLACETPVVTSNNCGASFFLRKYNCIETVPPGNATDLSNKIIELLRKPFALKDMGNNGRKIVVEHFDWKIIGKRLGKIYMDILKNN